jgi:hypothetical protein
MAILGDTIVHQHPCPMSCQQSFHLKKLTVFKNKKNV